jgi:hypothetical protein
VLDKARQLEIPIQKPISQNAILETPSEVSFLGFRLTPDKVKLGKDKLEEYNK